MEGEEKGQSRGRESRRKEEWERAPDPARFCRKPETLNNDDDSTTS